MHAERIIGGSTLVIEEQTASYNGELHRLIIVNTVARCPARLVVLMNKISFLGKYATIKYRTFVVRVTLLGKYLIYSCGCALNLF